MIIKMKGNNFNQRLVVHLPNDLCRTITGSGGSGGYHYGNEPKVIVNTNKVKEQDNEIKRENE